MKNDHTLVLEHANSSIIKTIYGRKTFTDSCPNHLNNLKRILIIDNNFL